MKQPSDDYSGPGGSGGADDPLAAFRRGVAHDLLSLALLHNEELDRELVARLRSEQFPRHLHLSLSSERGKEATELFAKSIDQLGDSPTDDGINTLAADYADIYLTHALRASPYESVWIDEDGLAMQEPMFQIRESYNRHGLAVQDWRSRSDDHLVLQLQFISYLIEKDQDLGEVATFMDEHLLRWLSRFASRVASRCATDFYASLCMFSAAYADEVRDLLADILGEARPTEEEIERRMKPGIGIPVEDIKYVPGTAPSW